MSIIVPAGNKNVKWSSEEETMVKTASAGTLEDKEEVNALYEAAKTYIQSASDCCKECKKPKNLCVCPKSDSKSDSTAFSTSPIIEVETPAGEAKEEVAKETIEVAVEKIEEAVGELKDAVKVEDVAEEAEVEIEIADDPCAQDAMPAIPGKDVSQSEIIVESTPGSTCACADKKVEMPKAAATEEEFCKFAKLSPANRKKLGDYWVNMLGYPKDYVSLMVKDFEK